MLREGGHLEESRVVSVRSEQIGEGEGFMGEILRLRVEVEPAECGGPRSLVAKLPTSDATNRAAGELLGVYGREVRFYAELADEVAIRTPALYYGARDRDPGERFQRPVERFFGRLPLWSLRLLSRLGAWLVRFSDKRYVLLLEDLGPGRVGDQVAGCTPDRARLALRALARGHASMWQSTRLPDLSWVPSLDQAPNLSRLMMRDARPGFEARFGARLPPQIPALTDWLDANARRLVAHLAARPETLLHGDYRLDNLFFFDGGGEAQDAPTLAALDWQMPLRGPGPYDAAYFLSSTLDPGVARAEEHALLRHYHESLCAEGVERYSFEACRHDYELSMLLMLQRLVGGGDALEFGAARGLQLVESWIDRLAARLEGLEPERLLELQGDRPPEPAR